MDLTLSNDSFCYQREILCVSEDLDLSLCVCHESELANTIDSGIDIGYFGGIDIDIGIDKRPLQLLVLILVLIRGLPELLAILFIKENTVITASRQRQPTFPSVFLLFLPA